MGSLIKQYESTCSRYQAVEGDIRKQMADSITRSAQIALNRELTSEEKKEFINDPNKVQQIYQNQLTAGASQRLINLVSDLDERHKDILKLERVKINNF
jgi:t-SNARE complex subunit (syntaxin)